MKKLLVIIALPFALTGCAIGSYLGGFNNRLGDKFPDIRTVPERSEATQDRGIHDGNEKLARAADFKGLETDREEMKARVEALSEDRLPDLPEKEPTKKSKHGGKDGSSKSVERGKAAPSTTPELKDGATSSDQMPETFETIF